MLPFAVGTGRNLPFYIKDVELNGVDFKLACAFGGGPATGVPPASADSTFTDIS